MQWLPPWSLEFYVISPVKLKHSAFSLFHCWQEAIQLRLRVLAGVTVEIDIHGEDYVPSAVPPAEVLAANRPKKPAKEGKLIRQKAKAVQNPAAAALAPHEEADMEVVPSAAPLPGKVPASSSFSGAKPKPAKDWSDIDLSSSSQP